VVIHSVAALFVASRCTLWHMLSYVPEFTELKNWPPNSLDINLTDY